MIHLILCASEDQGQVWTDEENPTFPRGLMEMLALL